MSEDNIATRSGAAWLAIALAIGLIVGGWVLGAQIKATRLGDRYVTVRGLAERTVKADLAIWPLQFTETGDDLASLYSKTESDRKVIPEFLKEQGIQPSEISLGIVAVTDTQANQFGGGNRALHRYIVQQQVSVETTRVDAVSSAAQNTLVLLQRDVVLTSELGQGVAYKFTGLNSIKPDMITEATRNARAAAERFALDSESRVGSIRQANQGVFSIAPANAGAEAGEAGQDQNYAFGSDTSIMKKVRVVSTVEYYLEK
ncbi:MAG TPA: SIMPL domain-containing protein [Candidatus Acidoferrales bacterium]|nr:SIMPL domain-containing protein [Candidatus Acidoferrales bacterium]